MPSDPAAIEILWDFAFRYRAGDLDVHGTIVSADERQDGEPVTRVTLLLADPASDTWDVDEVRELRRALGRKATELGLPPVSLTLVPKSEEQLFAHVASQMPGYPIEPDKLLAAAERLAPASPGRGRPPYTAHRRAVSTAYYAVFHAISGRVVETAFPIADTAFHQSIRRWIGHNDVRTVARWLSQIDGTSSGNPPPHIKALLVPSGITTHLDADTVLIADAFLELNEKREQADYDHDAVFTRPDTRGHIALARRTVTAIELAQSDPAKIFFGLIAMQARVQARS